MMFRPKLVIFDLDGTLIEFPRHYIFSQAQRIITELAHPPVSESELEKHFAEFDFFRFVVGENPAGFIDHFWKTFDMANYPKPMPLPGAKDVLRELTEAGFSCALATARTISPDEIRHELRHTGFLEHLSHISCRPGEHVHWTDKTGHMQQICREYRISPEEVAMVGDIPTDIQNAKDVGLGLAVAVLSGGIRREVLEAADPDVLLDDIRALPELFGIGRTR